MSFPCCLREMVSGAAGIDKRMSEWIYKVVMPPGAAICKDKMVQHNASCRKLNDKSFCKHLMCLYVSCAGVFDFDWMRQLLFYFPKWLFLASWFHRLAERTPPLALLWYIGPGRRWPASVIVDLSWHLARSQHSAAPTAPVSCPLMFPVVAPL